MKDFEIPISNRIFRALTISFLFYLALTVFFLWKFFTGWHWITLILAIVLGVLAITRVYALITKNIAIELHGNQFTVYARAKSIHFPDKNVMHFREVKADGIAGYFDIQTGDQIRRISIPERQVGENYDTLIASLNRAGIKVLPPEIAEAKE